MCGIIGDLGERTATPVLMDSLERLVAVDLERGVDQPATSPGR